MRLRLLVPGALLAVLVALFTPMSALAQATTTTTHFAFTETIAGDVNPCSGAPETLTQTVKGVTHLTELPGGSYHTTTTMVVRFTAMPQDPSLPTYTGKATLWQGENLGKQSNYTATFTGHFTATGSDRSRITSHFVGHITRHVDGTVTVSFERQWLACPS
jgi:hypothetical protein